MFDFELGRISSWVGENSYKTVAVQLPEGLKRDATVISDFLKTLGVRTVVLGNPCYGACDVSLDFKKYADALIHFGHSEIPSQKMCDDVLYIESFFDGDVSPKVEAIAEGLPEKVGLLATVQYVKTLDTVKKILEKKGKKVFLRKGDDRIKYPGQVLGCNCSSGENMDVDCYLFIGEGDFHPLAAAFGLEKEIKVLNPLTGELRSVEDVKERILRRRFAAIESSKNANTFAVLICGKIGQNREKLAKELFEKIEKQGKKCILVRLDEINPQTLMPYDVDCFVSTACPRIAMDDAAKYGKPMLTATELDIALGLKKWEDYYFDTIKP